MHPILARLGPFTLYSYGAMFAIGFGLAVLLIYRRAEKFDLTKDIAIDIGIIALVAGIVGARVLYILLNFSHYLANPLDIPNLSKGGLVWYGGFLLASFILLWYSRKKRLNFWTITDLILPYVALAQGLGRIGCLLNGCCYGAVASSGYPFGITFPGESQARYPTQIYSSLALFAIFLILMIWQDRRHFKGEISLGYCVLYSLKRFFMEFARGYNPHLFFNLTLSQYISIIVFTVAVIALTYKAIEWKKSPSNSK